MRTEPIRLQALDSLRGIAAISVVIYHYSKFWSENNEFYTMFSWGYTGVMLFFMISGFVIFMSVSKSKDSVSFLLKRFSRLYPTFWFCMILSAIVVWTFGLEDREVSFKDFLINFTMIPKVFGAVPVDGVYWTLIYEFFFYVFIALLIRLNLVNRPLVWIIPWLILCFLRAQFGFLSGPLTWILNLNYGPFFIAGILFYLIKFNGKNNLINHALLLACFIIYWISRKSDQEVMVVAIYFAVFYLFTYNKAEIIVSNVTLWLGNISFSLYLLHQNIGYIILNTFKAYNFTNLALPLFVALAFSLILATLVHQLVEKPVQQITRKKLFAAN